METILKRLNAVYQEKELSFDEIAQKTGYGKSTVHRYFTGEITKIPVDFIVAFAKITNTDPMWLIGYKEDKKNEAPTSESVLSQELFSLLLSVPEEKRKDVLEVLKATVKAMK